MAQKFSIAARSALMANISSSATSLTVDIALCDLFPVANTGTSSVPTIGLDFFKIVIEDSSHNIEIVYVRTRALGSANMTNLLRGQEGTTARAYLAGSIVGLRHTAIDLADAVNFAGGASSFWKTMVGWTTAALSRVALGATTVGDAVFTATSAATARTALGAQAAGSYAASGNNTDITSLGPVTGISALVSDYSNKLATTAFVKSVGPFYIGVAGYNANNTLTTANYGQFLIGNAGTFALNLPIADVTNIGRSINYYGDAASFVTFATQSAQPLYYQGITVPNVFINPGDFVTFVNFNGSAWIALSSLVGFGQQQSWQNVVGSRALGTTYTNATGRTIFVSAGASASPNGGTLYATVDGINMGYQGTASLASGSSYATLSFPVAAGKNYAVINNSLMSLSTWAEFR